MNVFDKLPNGAIVMACTKRHVLASFLGGFVTWEYFQGDPNTTFNGHYFKEDLAAALNDYTARRGVS